MVKNCCFVCKDVKCWVAVLFLFSQFQKHSKAPLGTSHQAQGQWCHSEGSKVVGQDQQKLHEIEEREKCKILQVIWIITGQLGSNSAEKDLRCWWANSQIRNISTPCQQCSRDCRCRSRVRRWRKVIFLPNQQPLAHSYNCASTGTPKMKDIGKNWHEFCGRSPLSGGEQELA